MLQVERDKVSGELLGITSEFRNRKRGVETKLILENAAGPRDKPLFRNIAPAHRYFDKILDGQKFGEIAKTRELPLFQFWAVCIATAPVNSRW